MNDIKAEVRRFVVDNFLFGQGADGLKNDDSFLGKGIVDSTGIMELIMHLEVQYEMKVQDQDLVPENLDSIDRVAAFVARKKNAKN